MTLNDEHGIDFNTLNSNKEFNVDGGSENSHEFPYDSSEIRFNDDLGKDYNNLNSYEEFADTDNEYENAHEIDYASTETNSNNNLNSYDELVDDDDDFMMKLMITET